jgi:hypothetical protein
MDLDLVHRRDEIDLLDQGVEVVGQEVGDANRPDLAVGQQRPQRTVRLQGEVEARGQGLVQDQQVDLVNLVDAEPAGGPVEGVQRGVVAVVADPDLPAVPMSRP